MAHRWRKDELKDSWTPRARVCRDRGTGFGRSHQLSGALWDDAVKKCRQSDSGIVPKPFLVGKDIERPTPVQGWNASVEVRSARAASVLKCPDREHP